MFKSKENNFHIMSESMINFCLLSDFVCFHASTLSFHHSLSLSLFQSKRIRWLHPFIIIPVCWTNRAENLFFPCHFLNKKAQKNHTGFRFSHICEACVSRTFYRTLSKHVVIITFTIKSPYPKHVVIIQN